MDIARTGVGVRADIATPRLVLRPVDRPAAEAVLTGRPPAGLSLADGYPSQYSVDILSVAADGRSPQDVGPYFVVRRSDLAVIGEIGCRVDEANATAHVGYTIVQPCWNLGYATEALQALLGHLLGTVRLPRVEAETLADHGASRRVMEKAGMRLRSTRSGSEDGSSVEHVRYEAVAGAWAPMVPVPVLDGPRSGGGGLLGVVTGRRARNRRP